MNPYHIIFLVPYGRKFWWEDILAVGENMSFGGIYLAVEPVLAIMIFIAKWLIEHAGNLNRPWASFHSVRTKSMIKFNWELNKSLLRLIWTVFVPSVFTAIVYTSIGSPALTDKPTLLLRCTKLFGEAMSLYAQLSNSMLTIRLVYLVAGLVHRLWFCNTDDVTLFGRWNIGGLLSKPPIRQHKFPTKISGHTVYLCSHSDSDFTISSRNCTLQSLTWLQHWNGWVTR